MGLSDYLRARRERESAISAADLEGLAQIGGPGAAERGEEPEDGEAGRPAAGDGDSTGAVELPGADATELAKMIGAAFGGTPQISTAGHRLDGPDQLSAELLRILAQAGARPGEQGVEVEPEQAERMLEQVRARIAQLEAEEGSPADRRDEG